MVIHAIVELGVVSSVREVPNFYEVAAYQIGDFIFSLDDIEHGILRANSVPPRKSNRRFGSDDERFQFSLDTVDPRIHFALGCGVRSRSRFAHYEADRIDDQLDGASTDFVNSAEVIVLPEDGAVYLSQIFLWYRKDFGGRSGIRDFLVRYLKREDKAALLAKNFATMTIEYLFFDWSLDH